MTPSEAAVLLSVAAAYDNRTVSEIAARAWATPAAGLPVASTTTSTVGSAQASRPDATKRVRAIRS